MEKRGESEARYVVRPGRRDDAAAAAALWMKSAEEHTTYDAVYSTSPDAEKIMRRFLADLSSSAHSCLFVAEALDENGEPGEVVGFLSGEIREGSPAFSPKIWAAVEDIYVTQTYRSQGIGRALVDASSDWARDKGADGVSLQVAAGNERARKFYDGLGFREVSVYEVREF